MQEFKLSRKKECDGVLEQFLPAQKGDNGVKRSAWKFPEASDKSAIPFGKIVPCYELPEPLDVGLQKEEKKKKKDKD